MKEPFNNKTNQEESDIARKLHEVAEQTQATSYFVHELEEQLRGKHKPKTSWLLAWQDLTPTLGWMALVLAVGILLIWSIRTLVPTPQPAADGTPINASVVATPTPIPGEIVATPPVTEDGYDWRGGKLIMEAALPVSPAQANVYILREPQALTADYALALAAQFGIQGGLYAAQGQIPGTSAFMVTDGKQQLMVFGENNYTYTSDMVESSRNYNGYKHEDAEATIREYLDTHGLGFDFRLNADSLFGGYTLEPLAPDGIPMKYEYYSQPVMRISLTADGNILGVNGMPMDYDPNPVGAYGIITADEALQILLNDSIPGGKIESGHSSPDPSAIPPQNWYHDHPDNETVTIYGYVISSQAVDPNQPPVIFIDSVSAIGNTQGMESVENYSFVRATGQFMVEDGIRKFNVEAWDQNVQQVSTYGSARHDGDQVIITNEDGSGSEYVLVDPPPDLPLDSSFPNSTLSINGVIVDQQFHWTSIQFIADASQMGGGGGGGGMGFYQLNLSGTPIPFPTPIPTEPNYSPAELASFLRHPVQPDDTLASIAATYNVSAEDIMRANAMTDSTVFTGWTLVIPVPGPTRLEGERGMIRVEIFEKPDGNQRSRYMFFSEKDQSYFELKGDGLEALQSVHNRPITIWGSISIDESGMTFLTLEKFESLYPDLQFQILKGTQEMQEINGLPVVLFTTGGITYAQLVPMGGYPDSNYYEYPGEVNVEVLQIPDESYAGYPAIRVFNSALAANPTTGDPLDLNHTASTVEVLPDPYGDADQYTPPNIIIEKVELVYFVSSPSYNKESGEVLPAENYIQPAWHFQGHNSNGDEIDILIQALKPEFLLPEFAPHITPG